MRTLYTVLLGLSLPFVFLRLLWRSRRVSGYRQRWGERLGIFVPPARQGGLWVHAVSVGEVQAVLPLVHALLERHPDLPITLTTTTPTGSDQVQRLLGDQVFHVYLPYDLPFALEGFIRRVRPRHLLMVETEIWPNLLAACANHGISTLLANARLSERSARRYARLGRFTRETFAGIGLIAAQSKADAKRFRHLGLPAERVVVTGSIKFDVQIAASIEEQAQVMRRLWADRPTWAAGSTHHGEDEQILAAHKLVMRQVPRALLVLVPRHPERFERVAQLCRREGMRVARRSLSQVVTGGIHVYLADTMGELPVILGAADAAFIGGSLVPVGGHNMLEASAQGVPVCFGPHVFNFAAISDLLLREHGAMQVVDATGLGRVISTWLADGGARAACGEHGLKVVKANRGALQRLLALVPVS